MSKQRELPLTRLCGVSGCSNLAFSEGKCAYHLIKFKYPPKPRADGRMRATGEEKDDV